MLKELFFVCLRCVIGFVLIAPLFIMASEAGHLPESTYSNPDDPVFKWFFEGTMLVWIMGSLLSVAVFMKLMTGKIGATFAFAPIYLPWVYGLSAYLWLFKDKLF